MMKKHIFHTGFFILLWATLATSCRTAKEVNLMQDKGPYYAKTQFKDYRLQFNDEIYCTILTKNTDFAEMLNGVISTGGGNYSSPYTIYEDGNISIPFFGDIKVVGLTIPEAEAVIQKKMQTSIVDAQVIVNLRNKLFYIVSNRGQNGSFQVYKDNMTLFQALALSGQPDEVIDYSKVKIVRVDADGRSVEKEFDLRTTSVIESEFYYIKHNDVIYYSASAKKSFFNIPTLSTFLQTVVTPIFYAATIYSLTKKTN